ncbi:MAG: AAA family ATPase [Treponema succinifaciens]|uniref:ATP-binding protein n=1 Tax=Treponema succinifaciens TaxID=167 RepID=UPI0023572AC5|nr:AAA family ATPase [Treponema succinifaciens]MCI6912341.1 AAA family ATPase [Treponema succinifaciens]
MEKLIELFRKKMTGPLPVFERELERKINWNARLISVRGSRGTGKTTLFLQHIKKTFSNNLNKVLYVNLDNVYFSNNTLVELAEKFASRGCTHLFIDEVHKYENWSKEIKNLYDDFPELHIAFTGSSLLEILNGRADLSRRTLVYELTGLSFREYLSLIKAHDFPIFTLEEILKNNEQISAEIASKIKPFEFFDDYLSFGYYPYFLEGKDDYFNRLNETLNMILEVELPMLRGLEIAYIPRIKKLLAVIGESAPFIPNITQLAAKIGISRQTLLIYLKYLEDAKLINQLYKKSRGLSVLEKPEKILMENTNLIELFNGENANTGSRRETFVLNQLLHSHKVDFSEESDFFVDSKYTFEVGGKNKKRKQIQEIPDSYIIADDIEFGTDRRIPIWLLGFMY